MAFPTHRVGLDKWHIHAEWIVYIAIEPLVVTAMAVSSLPMMPMMPVMSVIRLAISLVTKPLVIKPLVTKPLIKSLVGVGLIAEALIIKALVIKTLIVSALPVPTSWALVPSLMAGILKLPMPSITASALDIKSLIAPEPLIVPSSLVTESWPLVTKSLASLTSLVPPAHLLLTI